MTDTSLGILLTTTATIAIVHTALGVDHTLPFVALGRARQWSLPRTLVITAACGLAHVLASVVIGLVGIGIGQSVSALLQIETARGQLGVWLLIGFGTVYACWGVVQLVRGRVHSHAHLHAGGIEHEHDHDHAPAHMHPHDHGSHDHRAPTRDLTSAWLVFLFLVFGPCEALIPLMTAPALAGRPWATAAIVAVFAVLTIATMVLLVTLGYLGAHARALHSLDRYVHVFAGTMIAASGFAVLFLGF